MKLYIPASALIPETLGTDQLFFVLISAVNYANKLVSDVAGN